MKVRHLAEIRGKYYFPEYVSAEPDSKFTLQLSVQHIYGDETYPKFVALSQDDEGDEYYHQTIVADIEEAKRIVEFLKKEFDL